VDIWIFGIGVGWVVVYVFFGTVTANFVMGGVAMVKFLMGVKKVSDRDELIKKFNC